MKLAIIAFLIVTCMNSTASFADDASTSDASVLRHAVFFSFKESSSDEDIQGVVDAFAALPSKIDTIIDFKWGKVTADAKMADGFTHAFLLSFQDEAGREAYLPHPDHKAFGATLGPHLKDVFVLDYWGKVSNLSQKEAKETLKHAVFFKFAQEATDEQITEIEEGFAGLPAKIDTVKHFEWGKNNSPESHDDGFTHGFMVTFDGPEGLRAYSPHPAHQAFVKMLGPVDQVRVIDFMVE